MDKQSTNLPVIPPIAGLIFGILAVSTASLFIRYAQREAPSLVIAAYRLTIASLVLAPFAIREGAGKLRQLNRKQIGLIVLSGIFLALHFATWISSLEYTSVASSVVLVTTAPLWVAVFSPVFLKEKIVPAVGIGLLIALIGGVVVGLSNACSISPAGMDCPPAGEFFQGKAFFGNLLALAGAFTVAGYMMIGRGIRQQLPLVTYIFCVYGTAAVILILVVAAANLPISGFSAQTYLWLLALGLVPQLLGHSSFNWALKYLPAAVVSVAQLGEPVGTVILVFIFLAEKPTTLELIGGGLILSGIYLAARNGAK